MFTIFDMIKGLGKIIGFFILMNLFFGLPFVPYYLCGYFFGESIFTDILLALGVIVLIIMLYLGASAHTSYPHASYNNEGDSDA